MFSQLATLYVSAGWRGRVAPCPQHHLALPGRVALRVQLRAMSVVFFVTTVVFTVLGFLGVLLLAVVEREHHLLAPWQRHNGQAREPLSFTRAQKAIGGGDSIDGEQGRKEAYSARQDLGTGSGFGTGSGLGFMWDSMSTMVSSRDSSTLSTPLFSLTSDCTVASEVFSLGRHTTRSQCRASGCCYYSCPCTREYFTTTV